MIIENKDLKFEVNILKTISFMLAKVSENEKKSFTTSIET